MVMFRKPFIVLLLFFEKLSHKKEKTRRSAGKKVYLEGSGSSNGTHL